MSVPTFYVPNTSLEVLITGVDASGGIDFVSVNVSRSNISNIETYLAIEVEDGVYCVTIKTGVDVENNKVYVTLKNITSQKRIEGVCISVVATRDAKLKKDRRLTRGGWLAIFFRGASSAPSLSF